MGCPKQLPLAWLWHILLSATPPALVIINLIWYFQCLALFFALLLVLWWVAVLQPGFLQHGPLPYPTAMCPQTTGMHFGGEKCRIYPQNHHHLRAVQ